MFYLHAYYWIVLHNQTKGKMDNHMLTCFMIGVMLWLVISSLIFGFTAHFNLLHLLRPIKEHLELIAIIMMGLCTGIIYLCCAYKDKYKVADNVFAGLDEQRYLSARIKYIAIAVVSVMSLVAFGWFMPLLLR